MVCGGNATVQKDGYISLWVPLLAGMAFSSLQNIIFSLLHANCWMII
jgi:hypothetical protein